MPRTVESIVSCHLAARARREAGRPVWDLQVPVRPLLEPFLRRDVDVTAEEAAQLARDIGKLLSLRVPASWRQGEHPNYSMDFEDLLERFEQATTGDFTSTPEYPETPEEVLNGWLDELYDWGDRCRVWLG